MGVLDRWYKVAALTREPFLAINAANSNEARRKKNAELRAARQTGDWEIPKAAIEAGLRGATVALFFRSSVGPSEVLTGEILSYRKNGKTKAGRDRYRLTVERQWRSQGMTVETFSCFFTGLRMSSSPVCVWMSEPGNHGLLFEQMPGKEGETRMAWLAQRVGHADFSQRLFAFWTERCALTGLTDAVLLQACHLVPWREANGLEKTDPANGLVLCSHLHSLMDHHLISFSDEGDLLLSQRLSPAARALVLSSGRKQLALPEGKVLSPAQRAYLARHRAAALVSENRLQPVDIDEDGKALK